MRFLLRTIGWALPCALLLSSTYGELHTFNEPIDALSIGLNGSDKKVQVSVLQNDKWTPWQSLGIEDEDDPNSMESDLLLFDTPVLSVQVRGTSEEYTLHPIVISQEPPSYQVAATSAVGKPRIYSRSQWRADEDLLIRKGEAADSSESFSEYNGNGNGEVSARVQQCEQWQKENPNEFKVQRTVTENGQGEVYRWPQGYSADVELLVVHHTAMKTTGDSRTGHERMRALYQYHADNRGWGDIGYHYIIDEKGQIFEGRAGGKYVVGGHVYCANTGTIGIALMGNFDEERPAQSQVKALQWLLKDLADEYGIDVSRQTKFHGIVMPPIVGHRDLLSTACPGHYLYRALSQIRRHVIDGDTDTPVRFPSIKSKSDEGITPQASRIESTLTPVGTTEISGLPGGQTRISLLYRSGDVAAAKGNRIADVIRSNPRIGIWQDTGSSRETRVRRELILPRNVRKSETLILTLRLQFPRDPGTYTLRIGDIEYSLTASGRRTRELETLPIPQAQEDSVTPQQSVSRLRPTTTRSTEPTVATSNDPDSDIRILLEYEDNEATLSSSAGLTLEGNTTSHTQINLKMEGGRCVAYESNRILARGIIRVVSRDGITSISSWQKDANRFRGIIECQIVDNKLVLINELSLESYLSGLAEEPDTEPFEKQRAFAIAARSYAAHYIDDSNRKFPGKPYDGDDSPARFQKYGGSAFEERNPEWVRAVQSTDGMVLMKNGQVLKAAYFSSDDGRTRSPEENGWNGFPFAEVFVSKPDPWCNGMELRGHGVGMSGCGAKGQAQEGKTAEEILEYYYRGAELRKL